jgi:Flp pilus assembly protein TadD
MPYCGGASLGRLLEDLSDIPVHLRTGRHLLEAVDRCQHPTLPGADDGPYRRYLDQASYVQAVCWIVACLADALHEAHSRGLVHMDVKPSNLLIAGDGQPMLLDFHLARKPIKPGERPSDRLGGTPGWMAPEQEAALTALSQGQSIPHRVDHRADLYSLGLLLCETLSGSGARTRAAAGEPWSRGNPLVSTGLSDIAVKCLATNPHERYRDAASLADDLRRHLNDLPLRGVPNRSLSERWQKWRRRKPVALARGIAWLISLAVLGTAAVAGTAFYRQRIHEIETDLEDGQRSRVDHRFTEAARVLNRGLERATVIPTPVDLKTKLDRELRLARRGQKAVELHRLADLARFWYGISPPAGEEARRFVEKVRALWEARSHLLSPPGEDLEPEVERGIRTDLLELAIVWANLRERLASHSESAEACREVLNVLDEASALCGPSPALLRERRACAATLNHAQASLGPELPIQPDPPARTAWEHYDLGRSYLRSGLIARAAQEFRLTLQSRPQDFWPNFYEGLCAYELGQFEDAVAAFRTCIALAPESAECYYNRARAEDSLDRTALAQSDYTRALELDPTMAVAALNRGIIAYKTGRLDQATADLKNALESATDAKTIGRVHYNLALVYKARGEQNRALSSASQAVAHGYLEAAALRDSLERGR